MPWPFLTIEELQRLAENQEPGDVITETGIQITTTHTPLFDRNKTVLTLRTYRRGIYKRALLLLHDINPFGGASLALLACKLSEQELAVHILSLRGFGSGIWYSQTLRRPGETITLQDYLEDLEMIIPAQELVPEQLILIGEGMGGILAQVYAQHHEVAGLVLLNSCSTHRAKHAWPLRPWLSWHQIQDNTTLPIKKDYRQLAHIGFRSLSSRVLVLNPADSPISSALVSATARDYGVEAIPLSSSHAQSYWDEVANHLSRFAAALS